MRQPGPDILIRSRWSPWAGLAAVVFFGAFGMAFLFGGWQESRLDCRRAQAGQPPDCTLVNEAVGGLFSDEIRLKAVRDVQWAESRSRSSSLRAVEIVSESGRHRLGRGASNMNNREKYEALREIAGYLQDRNDTARFRHEANLVNFMAWVGAGALALGLFLFWAMVSSLLLPARIRSTADGSALWIRRNPGQLFGSRVAVDAIRSVRVIGGQEAFARVFPRISRIFGKDLPPTGPSDHGQSALVITLEEGRELVIPDWVPADQLSRIAAELREFLGLGAREESGAADSAAPAAGAPDAWADASGDGNVFRTGHPRLHQAGQVLVVLTGLALLVWVILPMNLFRMLPGLGIGGVIFLMARELMSAQEITVDPPLIRVRRKALRGFSIREERISSFSRIEFRERTGDGGSWFRGVLVHTRGGSGPAGSVMFAQGRERAEVARQCERMAGLTGLPIQGGSG